MKKAFAVLFISAILTSCGILNGNNPMTAFIVKNTSEKPINFSASVLKHSQIMGPQIIDNSFTVKPKDSIIVRQTYFKRDGENPQNWFQEFKIFPVDGIELNDPKKAENWVKSSKDNIPIYTFTINK
ncbi:MAG TPA: hypothetical protein VFM70_08995 [Salinimicrobium sp.]|nr:hypothetical protein [Salinimicrobium sp.]